MIGHDCTACGATLADCNISIRDYGVGCCDDCFLRDSHGMLDQEPTDLSQAVDNLNRVAAQMVIARHEHANALRKLRAEMDTVFETLSRIEGNLERVDGSVKAKLLAEVMLEARLAVRLLPERVGELEACVDALEQHLKLRRRPAGERGANNGGVV